MAKPRRKHCPPDTERLAALSAGLNHRIRGQAEVLERLVEAVVRRELNTAPQTGCREAFFFAGPTGVGKTETARLLAAGLFGDRALVRFDCSEYKTLESVAALLGNRAGDPGRFGQAYASVRAGVWLFDEIEKSHPEFVHLFLQMTEAGRLTLASGETLDLSRLYIVVTSNLGSAEIIGREHLPFASLEKHVVRCIQRHLRPELLARFKRPFVFRPLSREVQAEIAEQRVRQLVAWHLAQGRRIAYDNAIVQFVLQRGFSPRLGARPLLDTIHELVGNAISEDLLAGGCGEGRLVIAGQKLRLMP